MGDKIYIKGKAKEIDTQYGPFLKLSFKLEDLKEHVNEQGYINLNLNKRKEVGQYGDTHSITLDTWKPKQKPEQGTKQEDIDISNIPF